MKKLGLISLVVVLALGALGVAGALWWDWLYIDGYVETGSIGAHWSVDDWWDNEPPGKDVSYVNAYLAGPDGDDLYIDIFNAYPCVTYTVVWNIECTGSVPIHFAGPFIGPGMSGDPLPPGATLTFTDLAGNRIDWSTVQLHQGDVMYGLLTVHLGNDALQDHLYGFGITLDYGQYNEFPPIG